MEKYNKEVLIKAAHLMAQSGFLSQLVSMEKLAFMPAFDITTAPDYRNMVADRTAAIGELLKRKADTLGTWMYGQQNPNRGAFDRFTGKIPGAVNWLTTPMAAPEGYFDKLVGDTGNRFPATVNTLKHVMTTPLGMGGLGLLALGILGRRGRAQQQLPMLAQATRGNMLKHVLNPYSQASFFTHAM